MEKYIKALRAAQSACKLSVLREALDAILAAALRAYKEGKLNVLDYSRVGDEYVAIIYRNNISKCI